jgi:hypothetical protein
MGNTKLGFVFVTESLRSDHVGPSNQAVIATRNVSMSCMDVGRSKKGVVWQIIEVGTNNLKILCSNQSVLQHYEDRFRVQENNNSYTLTIENLTPGDAGAYYCLTEAGVHIAQLIVLGNCH